MARLCPVCGKGPFKERDLKRHIRLHHTSYFEQYIKTGSIGGAMRKKRKKRGEESGSQRL